MSFKRFDPEDIVLSSELITFPTWYTQREGDTDKIEAEDIVSASNEQGRSIDYYVDFYSGYQENYDPSQSYDPVYDPDHSKPLFSLAFAERPSGGFYTASTNTSGNLEPINKSYIIFGQYRSLVLGDEYNEFYFGSTYPGSDSDIEDERYGADSFIAMTVDRSRFREKLDPSTCQFIFNVSSSEGEKLTIVPNTSANRRYLDAGRVFDLVKLKEDGTIEYPTFDISGSSVTTSYGYFLPDIGVVLFNTSRKGVLFDIDLTAIANSSDNNTAIGKFFEKINTLKLRSQETVTSNFVFVRARNGEFNYSTNPSNIVGAAGNIRHNVMINQPQSFITTVGLYNDANELLAVAKLSRPLIKDFTKEALIRIKLDY